MKEKRRASLNTRRTGGYIFYDKCITMKKINIRFTGISFVDTIKICFEKEGGKHSAKDLI